MRKKVLLAAAVLLAARVVLAADGSEELKKLEGVWKATAFTKYGKEMKDEEVTGLKLTIKGDQYTLLHNGGRSIEKGTVKLDLAKTPKELILKRKDNSYRTWIYERKDDTLKICYSTSPPRPKEFASKAGSRNHLILWKKTD